MSGLAIRYTKMALGIPMIFNNIITGRTLTQAHAACSFSDPYIGKDAGYVQVTRLNGHGPVLLVDPGDPFHRSPSVMSYDRKDDKIVMQDSRVWIAGLGDEGGSGSWLATAMKLFGRPDKTELDKYLHFIDGVLYGGLQYKDGPMQYGVRKSMFYYAPDALPPQYYSSALNWKSWTSWDQKQAESAGRSFNYPHVVAAYWCMYRLARNHVGLVTNHPWDWYLNNAYETTLAMTSYASDDRRGLVPFGQMEGSIFLQVLLELEREGWTRQADTLEAQMKARADLWKEQDFPYGSEMPDER